MMNDPNLEEADTFIYIGTTICKDGTSSKEIKQRSPWPQPSIARLKKSRTKHKTNEYVRRQVNSLAGKHEPLFVNGETTKALLAWPHHPTQHHYNPTCKAPWRAREDEAAREKTGCIT